MNEKNLESVRRCSSLLCVRAVCVVRTAWCGVVRTIIIWKRWCQLWRARMIRRWAGRGKRDYLPGRGAARLESLRRTQTRASRSQWWIVLHGLRVPIIDFPPRARTAKSIPWRRKRVGRRGRPYFSGRFRTHVAYHWPPAKKGGPAQRKRPVFILTSGMTRLRSCRSLFYARVLAALPTDARWRHCGRTGYPAVGPTGFDPRLYFYFV